jgi:uncharacterized protein YjbI with pentapeptide repeats
MVNAYLSLADLSHANLSGANLLFADLNHANLNQTNLTAAKLLGALNLTRMQLDEACGHSNESLLDEGLTLKPCRTSPADWSEPTGEKD